jgi:hypothetical protein
MFWYSLVAILVWPFITAKRDALTFPTPEKVEKKWHALGWFIRASVTVPLIFYMFGLHWTAGYLAFAYGLYFSFVLDVTYNKLIYNDYWRVGVTADWDEVLKKAGFVLKPLGIILSIGAYLFYHA